MGPLVTVTALFTDLVGSTSLESRVGPVVADQLRAEYFSVLREALVDTGGREVKSTGDGVMAVFSRAAAGVECAVLIQRRRERGNAGADEPMDVRVGVNIGDATAANGDYYGLAVNVASRLCDAAERGQILTTELVKATAAGRGEHEFAPVGELELKGLPGPTPAWEVRWQPLEAEYAGVPVPARLAQAPPTGYVGRQSERERLTEMWAAAES